MNQFVVYWLLSLLTLVVCVFALWKGDAPERIAGASILGVVVIERTLYAAVPPDLLDLLGLGGDALIAMSLLVVALLFARPWLGAVMLFYAAQFALHSVYLVTGRERDLAHYWINNVNFAGIHICLILGVWMAWRARRSVALQPA